MYLRGEFKNILEHRGFPQLLSSWPTDNDIKTLVDAADGLFAHPTAVLRHVAYPPDLQFRERLQSVLDNLSYAGERGYKPFFSQLDALYLHIMKQIPETILLSAQFLLFAYAMRYWEGDTRMHVSVLCCMFRISEYTFKDICHHLHAVISYEAPLDPLSSIDSRIDFTRPYYDQGQWFNMDMSIIDHVLSIHGSFRFYHKSFYDFLRDLARSGAFCVNTPVIYCKFLDHLIQHHHHCASSYVIDDSSTYFPPCIYF